MITYSGVVERLNQQIRISEYVSKSVKLQKRGANHSGLCPFHQEKTPSFSVIDSKNLYHCFGCGASGDLIKFVQSTKNLGFVEAVKYLASIYGIELPKEEEKRAPSLEGKIKDINMLACEFFKKNLYSNQGIEALKYLEHRGITRDEINKFSIGYGAKHKTLLMDHLSTHGYTYEELKLAGLVVQLENSSIVDKFKGRIIFPIFNRKNEVIAFGGRSISDDYKPKYLNSPETVLFKKKETFYGENFVFTNRDRRPLFMVEGYLDLISMYRAGVSAVVATLGTAISEFHLKKAWTVSEEPTLCLDGDTAGIKAMLATADLALGLLKPGYSVNFVQLPGKMDPEEALTTFGKDKLMTMLSTPIPLSEVIWNQALNITDGTTPEKQALLRQFITEKIAQITDFSVKEAYKQIFNKKIFELFRIKGQKALVETPLSKSCISVSLLGVAEKYELTLLALVVQEPLLLKSQEVVDFLNSNNLTNQHAIT